MPTNVCMYAEYGVHDGRIDNGFKLAQVPQTVTVEKETKIILPPLLGEWWTSQIRQKNWLLRRARGELAANQNRFKHITILTSVYAQHSRFRWRQKIYVKTTKIMLSPWGTRC
jgi:hypothetical protein